MAAPAETVGVATGGIVKTLIAFIAVGSLTAASGCERLPAFKTPPAGSYTAATYELHTDGASTSVQGARVARGFFEAAEVRPFIGRFFVDADAGSSASPVVVLSHDLWTARFGSSPSIVGRAVNLDGRQVVVLGVAAPGFSFPDTAVLWTPERK
jgi:hypothetical protein